MVALGLSETEANLSTKRLYVRRALGIVSEL